MPRKASTKTTTKTAPKDGKAASNVTTITRKIDPAIFQKRVEEKAFELFQRRGGFPGWEQFDWKLAEKLVELESKKKSARLKLNPSDEKIRQRIAGKAFEIFEQKGYVHGSDEFDWWVAEQFVQLESK